MQIKRIFLLLTVIFTAGGLWGNPDDANRTNSYFEKIDFEFINNKLIIPVTINGSVYRFLFDTGAPNVISKELYEKIGPEIIKSTKTTDAVGNSDDLNIVQLPEIMIGNYSFSNTRSLVYDIRNIDIFKCLDIDGFIGSNLLKNSIVQIDFANKTLILTNNKHNLKLDKNNATKMELIGEQSSPLIFIEIKGKMNARDQVLIDTGMDGFYDLSHRSYDIFKNNDILQDIATAKGGNIVSLFGNAEQTEQHRVFIPSFNVAGTLFEKLVTTTTTDDISRIGTDMLKHGIITIDFKNKRFYFEAAGQPIDVSKPLPGFSPTVIDGKLSVGYVWDKKLKEELNYGDEIVKINDTDITKMDFCEFFTLKDIFEKQDTLAIEFKDKTGKLTKLTIVKNYPEL